MMMSSSTFSAPSKHPASSSSTAPFHSHSLQSLSNQSIHSLILSDSDLQHLYSWVDSIPLSRPKRNINRDFSDGILLSEMVHYFYPKLVELHNYSTANNSKQKMYNLTTLNTRVLKKYFKFQLDQEVMDDIVACKPGMIEKVLFKLKLKMAAYTKDKRDKESSKKPSTNSASSSSSVSSLKERSSLFNINNNVNSNISGQVPPPPLDDPDHPQYHHFNNYSNMNLQSYEGEEGGTKENEYRYHAHAGLGNGNGDGNGNKMKANNEKCSFSSSPSSSHIHMVKNKEFNIKTVDNDILLEKEATIKALNEKNELLLATISKMEQLLKVKDARITKLQEDLHRNYSASTLPLVSKRSQFGDPSSKRSNTSNHHRVNDE